MTTGSVKEPNLGNAMTERQIGCMTGFLQIFDRHQILTGKRVHSSAKRLSASSSFDSASESEISAPASPAISAERTSANLRSPTPTPATEVLLPPKSPLPLPIFDLKGGAKSSWKFSKEAPRLSLDSRANRDAKGCLQSISSDDGCQNRSPSVIARLMGLEQLPNSSSNNNESENKPELRRSASEKSRASRDLFHPRFVTEGNNLHSKQQNQSNFDQHCADPKIRVPNKDELSKGVFNSKYKSFFDSGDIFPEPNKQSVSIYGEIEKRLKIRGVDEPSKDLESLKQILEALQLKGLLHSKNRPSDRNRVSHRVFVYDESPIVIMKPSNSTPPPINRSQVNRRNYSFSGDNLSPRRSPIRAGQSLSTRPESNASPRRSNSLVKPKPLSVETQRRGNESPENRRVSPVNSPKVNARRIGPDPTVNSNRSPRIKKPTAGIHRKEQVTIPVVEEDESSSISCSSSSITTSTDTEPSNNKNDIHKEGRTLLDRCDKLLHSIAEMNATADTQPSPVSVLDSSFYKDDSPSPVMTKRNIDFKDESGELEEEMWGRIVSPIQSKRDEISISGDCDFAYISDILRASHYLPEDSNIFMLLEKQQYLKGNDTSEVSRVQRKLVFDTTNEILDRKRRLPPWKSVTWTNYNIWSEFQRIRECNLGEDLFEVICGVLKKDLAGDSISGWGDFPVEMSDAVLDIERLIFKDLVGETIQDLALVGSRSMQSSMILRRKLIF